MSDQLGLFDVRPPLVSLPDQGEVEDATDARFRAFHAENPEVYRELRDLALAAVRSGRRRVGMKQLFEVLRWNRGLVTTGDEFRLNNNYTSRYARLLMEQEPSLTGVFETRALSDQDEQ